MVYTTRRRNRFRVAVSAVTGVLTVTSLSATGWLAGRVSAEAADAQAEKDLAAQAAEDEAWAEYVRQQEEYAAALAAQVPEREVVVRQRPQRTRTTIRYVRASPTGNGGSGGGVSSSAGHSSSGPSSSGTSSAPGSGGGGGGGGGG
ncbi:hypothetical protein, partial [Nocardioides sp.]|uniref:hypothetical protein n=1 Tax=Nocardioides sp. TaxID=35761 RepID=UPI00356848B2